MRNPSSASATKTPCCSKVGIKRGPWTPEEDELLANYINRAGEGRWRTLPKRAGLLRCGKSCRLRWMNYLRPSVKRGRIAPDEEDLILRLHRLLGNRWSLIAGRIPGRTDNEIKNYWNTHLSKKLISQGIDPRTHKPLNLTNPSSSELSQSNPPPTSNRNPNSDSFEPEETAAMITSKNPQEKFTTTKEVLVDKASGNWRDSEGFMGEQPNSSHLHGNGGDYMENCNEDIFSSFLDSLINDNVFANQHQQQANIVVSTQQQTFNHENIWEAEVVSSMAAFGNGQNSLNNIHPSRS
ncbi:hypothetical protein SLEP1_g43849 [Rubroshorea leprosula]|uniref:Uncharacterized protein n=1 Tax=Rubroshorea leprosula TaxID=152421 RepID=A0AAV5LEB1_9ROSI|nr:hypothetical protein SLEP1_g43849 [Rubroshorea leprosula]